MTFISDIKYERAITNRVITVLPEKVIFVNTDKRFYKNLNNVNKKKES